MVAIAAVAIVTIYLPNRGAQDLSNPDRLRVDEALKFLDVQGFQEASARLRRTEILRNNTKTEFAETFRVLNRILIYDVCFLICDDEKKMAATLLHEFYHLDSKFPFPNEREAHARVWEVRELFGWTPEASLRDPYWLDITANTRAFAPTSLEP